MGRPMSLYAQLMPLPERLPMFKDFGPTNEANPFLILAAENITFFNLSTST